MSWNRRPTPVKINGGPPAWLIFLIGIAVVFGLYYVWVGAQNFLRTGGGSVAQSTSVAEVFATATAGSLRPTGQGVVIRATPTAVVCEQFRVIVPSARVRDLPNENAAVIDALSQDNLVCVYGRPDPSSEWYTVDSNPNTRRIEVAYMHESVIAPVNPTPTPSRTPTLPPSVTPTDTPTRTPTVRAQPSATPDPRITLTPTPTVMPSATQPLQSA
jgi:hypothetical protein